MRADRIRQRMNLKQRALNTRHLLHQMNNIKSIKAAELERGFHLGLYSVVHAADGLTYEPAISAA
jgi:hypothetical protein